MLGLPGMLFAGTPVVPGSQTFYNSGTFVVPAYNNLIVEVWGAGGGAYGATALGQPTNGGQSSFNASVFATGGQVSNSSVAGAGGSGSGGSINLTGDTGGPFDSKAANTGTFTANSGYGGAGAYNGGAGGASVSITTPGSQTIYKNGNPGSVPGGGGSGGARASRVGTAPNASATGYPGAGGGGYSQKIYPQGTYSINQNISVVVGIGGVGAGGTSGSQTGSMQGGPGANGMVRITWN